MIKVFIHVPKVRSSYQIQTDQTLSKYDRFKFNIRLPTTNTILVLTSIVTEIEDLWENSSRKIQSFVISGDEEICNILLDKSEVDNIPITNSIDARNIKYIKKVLNSKNLKIVKS